MSSNARQEILGKLKIKNRSPILPRPEMPALNELGWSHEQLVEKFTENLTLQTGVVYRVTNRDAALAKLTEIARTENLTAVMAGADDVLERLDLSGWGRNAGIKVMSALDFSDREAFKNAVFDEVQAGITGADWAIAETGTIALIHDLKQPRLVSLAPILHIMVIPVDKILPTYEKAIERIMESRGGMPPHMTLITGPSATADIQATFFKGMHGPRRVIALLVG